LIQDSFNDAAFCRALNGVDDTHRAKSSVRFAHPCDSTQAGDTLR
jgi:hypothetical protein